MAKTPRKPPMPPSVRTATDIKHLAGEGLTRPSTLTAAQVRELAASVMRHIEPRANDMPPPPSPKKPPGGRGKRAAKRR